MDAARQVTAPLPGRRHLVDIGQSPLTGSDRKEWRIGQKIAAIHEAEGKFSDAGPQKSGLPGENLIHRRIQETRRGNVGYVNELLGNRFCLCLLLGTTVQMAGRWLCFVCLLNISGSVCVPAPIRDFNIAHR